MAENSQGAMVPTRDGYPAGVPCWVDTSQPDVEAARRFYGGLFGWEFEERMPGQYHVVATLGRARRGGHVAAGRREGDLEHLHPGRQRRRDDRRRDAARRQGDRAAVRRARRRPHVGDRGPDRRGLLHLAGARVPRRAARQRSRARGTGATSTRPTRASPSRSTARCSAGRSRRSRSARTPRRCGASRATATRSRSATPGSASGTQEAGAPEGFTDAVGWLMRTTGRRAGP